MIMVKWEQNPFFRPKLAPKAQKFSKIHEMLINCWLQKGGVPPKMTRILDLFFVFSDMYTSQTK